jgi:PAS domain S-box-containing protein
METGRTPQEISRLQESEERWRAVFENSAIGVALTDLNGRFLATNSAYQRMVGYGPDEFPSLRFIDITHEDDQDRNRVLITELLEGMRDQFQIEKRYWRKDGTLIWVRNSVSLVPGSENMPLTIMAIVEDITERKRAEEAMQTAKARFEGILEIAQDAIISVDSSQRIILFNQGAEKVFGYTQTEVIGRPLDLLLPQRFEDVHRGHIEKFARSPDVARTMGQRREVSGRRKDGGEFPAEASISKLDLGGELLFTVILRDITTRKTGEEALQAMQLEFAHLTRVAITGEIAASIAHEISQPLTAVITNANASLRWLSGDRPNLVESQEALTRILRDANRAGDVIGRIRALLKKTPPQMERLDVNELIQDVLILTRNELVRNGISLRTELADDLPVLRGDRVQLQQVVLNLIVNSVEAMREVSNETRDLLVASRRHDSDDVLVSVRDSGVGIAPDRLEKIFTPFFTTKTKGLGMGLSISRSIIEAHAGRLWATGHEGRGTTIQFSLPTRIS